MCPSEGPIHVSTGWHAPTPQCERREQADPLVLRWLAWLQHSRGRSVATLDKYLLHLERLRAWLLEQGREGLLDATDDDLEDYCGLQAHRRGLTPRARRPLVSAVRGFYAWVHQRGALADNPATDLAYPSFGRPLPTGMGLGNAERLLSAPGLETFLAVRDTAILAVLLGCGLRLSGVAALNESHLLWERDEHGHEQLVIRAREKGGVDRMVPVDDDTRMLLHAYLGHPELEQIDRLLEDGDRVLFVSTRSRHVPEHEYRGEARRLGASSIQQMVIRRGESVGIPRAELHPHALRHTYGTELAEGGVDVMGIAALMGHRDVNSSRVYVRLAARKLRQYVTGNTPTSKIHTPVSDLVAELRAAKRSKGGPCARRSRRR